VRSVLTPLTPGWVYVLCYGAERELRSIDVPQAVSHYVGWTQQRVPLNRVKQHGARSVSRLVSMNPGSRIDEERIKATGKCAWCGQQLEYRTEDQRMYAQRALAWQLFRIPSLAEKWLAWVTTESLPERSSPST
jgi:hypothetical protein